MTTTIKKIDFNSSVNQNIKDKFVGIHVKGCVTSLIEFILSQDSLNAPFQMDEIENFYSYPEWSEAVLGENLHFYGGTETDKELFLENFTRLLEDSEHLLKTNTISEFTHERNMEIIDEAREDFQSLDTENLEVFEWWLVSDYLGRKLSELGHPIVSDGLNTYWGRCTTGQAILLDYAISQVCSDMEILEGQSNSWAK